jgi:LPXTG-motif cell wall-anchored protein
MKYRILITTLIVALATLGGVAIADTTSPTQIVTGKVISSTPTQLIVEDDNGARTTFVTAAGTVPSTIMVGDRVSVNYQSQAGGSFRATNVSATSLSGTGISDATGVNTNDTSTNDAMLEEKSTSTSSSTYSTTTTSTTTNTADVDASADAASDSLPATASNNPLILLLGLLALGGFALRMVVRS